MSGRKSKLIRKQVAAGAHWKRRVRQAKNTWLRRKKGKKECQGRGSR